MSANFYPNLKGYTGVQRLRFWAHKVLPLVYDESLSYYEFLCKVVAYLNDVIADLQTSEENIQELAESFKELQDYVNNWFDSKDWDEEISGAVADWIEAHPEVVTTVEDGSLTLAKFSEQLRDDVSFGVSGSIAPIYLGDFIGTTPHYGIASCCRVGDLIYCVEVNDRAATEHSNLGYVRVFDASNDTEITDGFPVQVEVGHGNSMAYDSVNECFYILPLYDYTSGSAVAVNYVLKYNTTFTQKEYVTIDIDPVGFMGVSYDPVNLALYGYRYDGKIYKYGTNGFELYTTLNTDELGGRTHYLQDFAVCDDIWYLSSTTGQCVYGVLAPTTIHANGTFNVLRVDEKNRWTFAEMEGFEFDGSGHLICAFYNFNQFVCDNFVTEIPTSHAVPYPFRYTDGASVVDTVTYSTTIAGKFTLAYNQFRHPSCIEFLVKPPLSLRFTDDFTETNAIEFSNPLSINIDGCTLECPYIYVKSTSISITGRNSGVLKLTGNQQGLLYPWLSSTVKLCAPLKLNLTQPANSTGNFLRDEYGTSTFFCNIPDTDVTKGNANTLYINTAAYATNKLYVGALTFSPD